MSQDDFENLRLCLHLAARLEIDAINTLIYEHVVKCVGIEHSNFKETLLKSQKLVGKRIDKFMAWFDSYLEYQYVHGITDSKILFIQELCNYCYPYTCEKSFFIHSASELFGLALQEQYKADLRRIALDEQLLRKKDYPKRGSYERYLLHNKFLGIETKHEKGCATKPLGKFPKNLPTYCDFVLKLFNFVREKVKEDGKAWVLIHKAGMLAHDGMLDLSKDSKGKAHEPRVTPCPYCGVFFEWIPKKGAEVPLHCPECEGKHNYKNRSRKE